MAEVFEELDLGGARARNRLVRSATAESLCTKEGVPSKRLIDYYCELARGGVGTIITGYAFVCADGKPSERALCLSSAADESVLRELTDAVHAERIVDADPEPLKPESLPVMLPDGRIMPGAGAGAGAPAAASADEGTTALIVAQLVYGGSKSKLEADDPRFNVDAASEPADGVPNVDIVGPSAVAHPATGLVPRAATAEDIERIIAAFANAAARAKRVGFDGVEVHAAHGYLLSQFLDPRFNKRDDEWGGSLENRARLAIECVRAVRSMVGDGFPVWVKLNSCDVLGDASGAAGGLSEEESLQVAQWLVEAGASCIDVSGDWHAVAQDDVTGEPFFGSFGVRLATKLGADVPVVVTGGWRDLDTIERYLETTPVAGFGMCRPLICQTILPELWRSGMRHAAKCISCNWCCGKNGLPCILRKGTR